MNNEFKHALNVLIEDIKQSYVDWHSHMGVMTEHKAQMIVDFSNKIRYTNGKKYIKVITDGSVWGFIVREDDGVFRAGDILKAASWNAPAKNQARGNILDGGYSINWTGPHYLR